MFAELERAVIAGHLQIDRLFPYRLDEASEAPFGIASKYIPRSILSFVRKFPKMSLKF
jgi:hypothetical protein